MGERPVEVPEVNYVDVVTQVLQPRQEYREKQVPRFEVQARERVVEVPQVLRKEVVVPVPEVIVAEAVKQVPEPIVQQAPKQIPKPVMEYVTKEIAVTPNVEVVTQQPAMQVAVNAGYEEVQVQVPVVQQVEVPGQTTVQHFGGGASMIGTNVVTGSRTASMTGTAIGGSVGTGIGAGSTFTSGASSGKVLGGGISAV